MKLASFAVGGAAHWGVVDGDDILDVGSVLKSKYPSLMALIAAGGLSEVEAATEDADSIPVGTVTWLPVILEPGKILCVGLNYEMHRQETGRAEVEHPTIFGRFANSQTGHLAEIALPKVSEMLDYEGELAIVIGKAGRYVPADEAMAHVAGYACYNDVSVRDFQWHTHQFTPGKNFPGTGAFGPWMITPDEMGDIGPQRLQTRLNGAVMQEAVLSQMIFDIPQQIAYCSSFTRLEPGDVIVTGTPGGVGAKRKPPLWMKPGDVVEVEIDKVGLLRNTIVAET